MCQVTPTRIILLIDQWLPITMIRTIQVILQKKKLETAVLVCVFSIVTALLCIPVSISTELSGDVDIRKEFGVDSKLIEIGSEPCQVFSLV